jgi:D-alanyl-D-alanine carboxypeptidase/D-alanyl-D-alanine-endopeptidase (penicillin-binding protein 4)
MNRIFLPPGHLRLLAGIVLAARLVAADAPLPAATTPDQLRARLQAHVTHPRFARAAWGVKVVSLDTGRVVFEHHADRYLSPASNSKLYTGALALDWVGGDYRIVTPLFGTAKPDGEGTLKGGLIVHGRGDPSWKARDAKKDFWKTFDPFVAALSKAGVRRVTGGVVADATWLRSLPNGSGWTADDLNDYYGAEISAITLEDNYAELRVTPAAAVGQPCVLEFVQPSTGLWLDNRTGTLAKGATRRVEARRIFGENTLHLFGGLPLGDKEELLDVTVPRPAQWFAAALKSALTRAGISVEGAPRSLRWPDATAVAPASVPLGEIVSPPMRELVTAFMKPSQNLETDLIFQHLGETFRAADAPARQTSEEAALRLLAEFFRKNNLPAGEVRFDEGSGLSRNNLLTANATVALLQFMAKHREAAAFNASLPIAGVDGTLRRRMKETAAEGNVRAKTGTLRYATSIAGYVTSAAGERLAFCVMLNRFVAATGKRASDEIDEVAVELARFAGRTVAADVRRPGLPDATAASLVTPAATPLAFAADTPPLRILSYNIHHGEGVDGRLELLRLAKVITDSGADLVALQEVDQNAARSGGVDQTAEFGKLTGLRAYYGKAMDFQGGAYGQALLSRWPLADVTVHALPNPAKREPRIAVSATVHPPGTKPFRFVGTHLDANREDDLRWLQGQQLVELFAKDRVPTVLSGDFNAVPESRTMKLLFEHFADASAAAPAPTIPVARPTRRIDFVLLRPAAAWTIRATEVLSEAVASDHRPLLVALAPAL